MDPVFAPGTYLALSGGTLTGALTITNATDSSSTSTGCLILSGGLGIAKNLYAGGQVVIAGTAPTSASSGEVKIGGGKVKAYTGIEDSYLRIQDAGIIRYDANSTAGIDVNYAGYNGGISQFRNFNVYNGKSVTLLNIDGTVGVSTFYGTVPTSVSSGEVKIGGGQVWAAVGGAAVEVVGQYGSPSYLRMDNTANSGGKVWRVGDTGAASFGSLGFFNQSDSSLVINILNNIVTFYGTAPTSASSGEVKIGGGVIEAALTATTAILRLRYNDSSLYGNHGMTPNGDYFVQSPSANGVTSGNLVLQAGAGIKLITNGVAYSATPAVDINSSGTSTFVGTAPASVSSGEVKMGGGTIRAATAIYCPTPTAGDNSTLVATTAFVATSFLTISSASSTYAPLASPALTGNPTAPTQTAGNNSTRIATTAFVAASFLTTSSAASTYAPLVSPSLTGTPSAPTATAGTNTTQIATTAFVAASFLTTSSAASTYLALSGGTVTGAITITGTAPTQPISGEVKIGGGVIKAYTSIQDSYLVIKDGGISRYDANAAAGLDINYIGYNGGTTQFRNLNVYNGKSVIIAQFDGTNSLLSISGTTPSSVSAGEVKIGGGDIKIAGSAYVGTIYIDGTSFIARSTGSMSNGAASNTGTLTNAPRSGNPTKWVPFDDNGTTRYIPMW